MSAIELYSFAACPYAQRTHITLLEKKLDFEIIEIDLFNRPDQDIWAQQGGSAVSARALFSGRSAQEAADALNTSPNTVKSHLAQIFQKTGVHSRTALLHLITTRSQI